MASSSKKKTTFAKMNRETAVRERRLRKQAKKEARKLAAAAGPEAPAETAPAVDGEESLPPIGDTGASEAEAPAGG
jgi:hypothetical protein